MPIEIDYSDELECLIVKVLGTVTHKDIIESRDQIVDHSAYKKNLDKIIDCSQGRLDLGKAEVDSISKHFLGSSEKMGDTRRTALVAATDANYGRIRQFEIIHGSNPGMDVMTFRSFSEAINWIRS